MQITGFRQLGGCDERTYIWARGLEERAEALQVGTCFMKAFETKAWEGVLCFEGLTFTWDGNGEKAEMIVNGVQCPTHRPSRQVLHVTVAWWARGGLASCICVSLESSSHGYWDGTDELDVSTNSAPFMWGSLEGVDNMVDDFVKWLPLGGLEVGHCDVKRLA